LVCNAHIRNAAPGDEPLILQLIREHAEHEQLSHEVQTDARRISAALFGSAPMAEVVIAELQRDGLGFALFFPNYSTFLGRPGIFLDDLYVRPAARAQGIGRMLLAHVAKLALERGCARVEWAVMQHNRAATAFYCALGAQPLQDWTVNRISGAALIELASGAPSSLGSSPAR